MDFVLPLNFLKSLKVSGPPTFSFKTPVLFPQQMFFYSECGGPPHFLYLTFLKTPYFLYVAIIEVFLLFTNWNLTFLLVVADVLSRK